MFALEITIPAVWLVQSTLCFKPNDTCSGFATFVHLERETEVTKKLRKKLNQERKRLERRTYSLKKEEVKNMYLEREHPLTCG